MIHTLVKVVEKELQKKQVEVVLELGEVVLEVLSNSKKVKLEDLC